MLKHTHTTKNYNQYVRVRIKKITQGIIISMLGLGLKTKDYV